MESINYCDDLVIDHKVDYVPNYGKSASGYGSRIPTMHKVKIGSHWYRVYAICWSNVSSLYVTVKGERLFVRFHETLDQRR